jgi:two-component system, NarL family, response regulator YdfI
VSGKKMLRVGLYASNAISRAGLLSLFQFTEIEIVAEADDLNTVHTLLEWQTVDAVCLELPELDTLTLLRLRELLEPSSESRPNVDLPGCVVVTTTAAMQNSASVASVLATGVRGLLPHAATPEELESTVMAVANGLMVLHPVFSDRLLEDLPSPNSSPEAFGKLSDRELQILDALSIGLSNKQIASQFYISEHTVKFHVSSILSKLRVSSRTEAVTVGIRQGLIKL